MKRHVFFTAIIVFIIGFVPSISAQINAGISIGDRGVRNFYLSVGNYYHVPQREVVIVHERRIPDEEIPVVFYIARHAHVSPREIADCRIKGFSWWEVSSHYGLGPDIYGQRVVQGPPYGKAWGYYKHNKQRNRYEDAYLNDNDIVSYVNTRVMRESYGCSDNEIHQMRDRGDNYVSMHDKYWNQRNGNSDRFNEEGKEKHKGNHGKGRYYDRNDD